MGSEAKGSLDGPCGKVKMRSINNPAELLAVIAEYEDEQQDAEDKTKLDDLFVLERWVKNCAPEIDLPYPGTLKLSEKPDFIFSGKSTAGVEVTRFLAEQRQRAARLAEQQQRDAELAGKPFGGHFPTSFNFDSPKRRNPAIECLLQQSPAGLVDFREIGPLIDLYVEEILEITTQKTSKVIEHGSTPCDCHILVIEDHHHISNADRNTMSRRLVEPMAKILVGQYAFKEVWFTSLRESDKPLHWRRDS